MKNLKKLFALVLAVAMMMSMAVTVSATEEQTPPLPYPQALTSTGTITIVGSAAGTQYTIYRLFDIVQMDDDQSGHTNAFKVRPEWASFIQESNYFALQNGYVNEVKLKDVDMQQFAAAAIKYAEDNPNTIRFDGQSAKLLNSGNYTTKNSYQYGFYIMTSNREADNFKYSIFTLDRDNVRVEEKTDSTVTLEKFVKEDSSTVDEGWTTENNAEIGQKVEFKIVIKVSAGEEPYVIVDEMPNFKEITDWNFIYSNGDIKDNYITVESLTPSTDGQTIDGLKTPINGGVKITLTPTFRGLMEDGNTVTITYTAILKHTADTTTNGNSNTATLTYDTNKTLTDSTVTRTNRLTVNKYDEDGNRLEGAVFSLSHNGTALKVSPLKVDDTVVPDTYVVDPLHGDTTITTRETGKFTICGLDTDDIYVLEEVQVPKDSNFIPMEPKNVTITANNNHHLEIDVVNVRGIDMPGTGGMGTTIFYIAGGLLTAAALILLVTKKRMGA